MPAVRSLPPRRSPWPVAAITVASMLAVVVLLSACGRSGAENGGHGAGGGMPPAAVAVLAATPVDVPVVYEYVGQTVGSREVEVRARVPGILQKRNFAEGAAVRQGQSLYTLDPASFIAALNRADADVAAAEARAGQASRSLARLKPLWEAKAISQREYDDALSADQIARADVKGAQARRAEAALNVGYSKVEAPISGVAGRSQVSEGTLVEGPQTLLTTLVQTHPIKLRFGVADTDQMRWRTEIGAGTLKMPPGGAFDIEVKLSDGSTYPRRGKLLFADTRVSGNTGTVEAEAEVPNPDGALKPGQFVRVRLLGATRPQAFKLPSRAVLEGPQGKFVYVNAGGKAMPKPVTVGDQQGDGWIIQQGLAAGDQVIVDGMARIFFPGAPVQVAAAGASAPAAGGAAPAAAPASAPAKVAANGASGATSK